MKKRITFTMVLLKKLQKELGFKTVLDRDHGDFGYLDFDNGVRHYVTRGDLRINRTGPHFVAGSKYYTDLFLKKHRYPIVESDVFFSESYCRENNFDKGMDKALSYAQKISYPIIIKPNNGMHGTGVQRVDNDTELKKGLRNLFKDYEKVIVQKFVLGHDYRIVVYAGKFVSAYRRVPLSVVGDGGSQIQDLLDERLFEYQETGRKFTLELHKIKAVLRRNKLKLSSIPKRGETIQLLDNANLSAGGYAEDVTDIMHSEYIQLAEKASIDMGLRLSGVDMMIQGDVSKKPKKNYFFFLELNASPGFHNYSELSEKAYTRIEKLFKRILKDIKKGSIKY